MIQNPVRISERNQSENKIQEEKMKFMKKRK